MLSHDRHLCGSHIAQSDAPLEEKKVAGLAQHFGGNPPQPSALSKKYILLLHLSVRMFLIIKREIKTNPDRIDILKDFQ